MLRELWPFPVMIRRGNRAIRLAARHAVYTRDIGRDFDYWHGAVEPQMQHGVAVVDYSKPAVHRLRPSGDLFRFLALPEHDDTTSVFLETAHLRLGELVLDLGAYCGATAVAFARAVGPTGHVVAFDPDPAAVAACRENVERHVPGQVTLIEAGVWRETGTVSFVAEGNVGAAVAAVLPRRGRTRQVPVLSLPDAAERAIELSGIPRIAYIKINVEGSEVAILEGGLDVLRRHRPRVAIEPHPDSSGRLNTDRVQSLLSQAGYRFSLHGQGSFTHPVLIAEPA
jgi:FkbM family methyltransferase